MGNCQAVDAATLLLQHPSGKVDKFYWPVSANEIMKMNPGHYVALLLSTTFYPSHNKNGDSSSSSSNNNNNNSSSNYNGPIRITRIKLLRPTDTLVLGHVYRLITTQEVMKGLWAKKQAKVKKNQAKSAERITEPKRSELDKDTHIIITKNERNRARTTTATATATSADSVTACKSSRSWHPSLKRISEAGNGN